MPVLAILQSKVARYIVGGVAIIALLLTLWTKYQEVKGEQKASDNRLKEMELAYKNQASTLKILTETITTLKKKVYTTTVTKPDGTTTTTTTEIIDSTTSSTQHTDSSNTPVFNNDGKDKIVEKRYPFMLYGTVGMDGWGVGPGWEVGRFNLPLLPYTYVGVGGTAGMDWNNNPKVNGMITVQWGSKK